MKKQLLIDTVHSMIGGGKGLLAIDEKKRAGPIGR
jgi:hypothetical protein